MSELETEAKPLLLPLITGTPSDLDTLAQVTVSSWAVKTAMVFEALRTDQDWFYTREDREHLLVNSLPPPRSSVWIAQYVGEFGAYGYATDLTGIVERAPNRLKGYVTTLALGRLAIQVSCVKFPDHNVSLATTVTANQRPGPWNEATARVFPAAVEAVRWPPVVTLTDEGGSSLELFCDRWGGGTTLPR